jgi:hypothetical protein
MSHAADPLRDLLFGMFALQNGLIRESTVPGRTIVDADGNSSAVLHLREAFIRAFSLQ